MVGCVALVLLIIFCLDERHAADKHQEAADHEGRRDCPSGDCGASGGKERPPHEHLSKVVGVPAVLPQPDVAPQILVSWHALRGPRCDSETGGEGGGERRR